MQIKTTGIIHSTGRKTTSSSLGFEDPLWVDNEVCKGSVRALMQRINARTDPNGSIICTNGFLPIYRSQRITLGKFRNFTPARSL